MHDYHLLNSPKNMGCIYSIQGMLYTLLRLLRNLLLEPMDHFLTTNSYT